MNYKDQIDTKNSTVLFLDASHDSEKIAREALSHKQQKKGVSYCSDSGSLIWLALPRKMKTKLEKRNIHVAKTHEGIIVIYKKGDAVYANRRLEDSYHFHKALIEGDWYAFSPALNTKEMSRVLKTFRLTQTAVHQNALPSPTSLFSLLWKKVGMESAYRAIRHSFENLLISGKVSGQHS